MKPVLVDTGFIVACLDRSSTHHARCLAIAEGLSEPLLTCEAVIAEAVLWVALRSKEFTHRR